MLDANNFWFTECATYGIPTVLLDAQTGRVVKINQEAIQLLKLDYETVESVVGKYFRNLSPICELSNLSDLTHAVQSVAATGRCATHLLSLVVASKPVPYMLTLFPVRNLEGRVSEVSIVMTSNVCKSKPEYEHTWAYNIIEVLPNFVSVLNLDNQIVYSNPTAIEMLGYPKDTGRDTLSLENIHSQGHVNKLLTSSIPEAIATGFCRVVGDLVRVDGTTTEVLQTLIPVRDKYDNLRGVASVITDLSTVFGLRKELADEQERAHILFDSAPYGCIVFDADFTPVLCNAVTVSMFQEQSKVSLLANLVDHMFEGFDESRKSALFSNILDSLHEFESVEMTSMHSTARGGFVEASMTFKLLGKDSQQIVLYLVDVSEHRKVMDMYDKLAKESTLDSLTGVQNRGHFAMKLDVMVTAHTNTDKPLYLLMLDIDNFKSINDTYGHVIGDEVLRALGATLRKNVRPIDVIARYGGEEFVILFENMDLNVMLRKAESLREAIADLEVDVPCELTGEPDTTIRITASIGLAQYNPSAMTDGDVLCACADKALYKAKREGKNCVKVYTAK